jgi:hypothetical protein
MRRTRVIWAAWARGLATTRPFKTIQDWPKDLPADLSHADFAGDRLRAQGR